MNSILRRGPDLEEEKKRKKTKQKHLRSRVCGDTAQTFLVHLFTKRNSVDPANAESQFESSSPSLNSSIKTNK